MQLEHARCTHTPASLLNVDTECTIFNTAGRNSARLAQYYYYNIIIVHVEWLSGKQSVMVCWQAQDGVGNCITLVANHYLEGKRH